MDTRIKHLIMVVPLAAVMGVSASLGHVGSAAAASAFPAHNVGRAACFGGGNESRNWDKVEVTIPIVRAYNAHPGTEDHQNAAWRARLMRWTGTGWVQVPSQVTGWSAQFTVTDGEGTWGPVELYAYGATLYPDRLGYEYRVWVDIYWYASGTVPYSFSDTIMPDIHLHQSGTYWLPGDPVSGSHSSTVCDYIPDIGYVQLP
jgi:hypothetical protein